MKITYLVTKLGTLTRVLATFFLSVKILLHLFACFLSLPKKNVDLY